MSPAAPLPNGYPGTSDLVRMADIEYLGFAIRMTVMPEELLVKLWELDEGVPVRWFGNVFRVQSEPPGLYLNFKYEWAFNRFQRDDLARIGAEFWAS